MAHVHRVVNRHCPSLRHQLRIGRFLNLQLTPYSILNRKRVVSGRRNGRHGLVLHILHFTALFQLQHAQSPISAQKYSE